MEDDFTLEAETKEYFGYSVTVYRTENSEKWMPSYPWRFSIMIEGQRHFYAGLPNKCETKASALKRAWHRARWLKEGSYHSRYCNGGG